MKEIWNLLASKGPEEHLLHLTLSQSQEAITLVPGTGILPNWTLLAKISDRSLYAGVRRVYWRTTQQALFAILFACLLAAWIATRIGGRILGLAQQATRIGEGHFDLSTPEPGGDELDILSQNLSLMGARIQGTQQALARRIQELEQARNQLIQAEKLSAIGLLSSGLAHEIHSPLQSISATSSSLRQLSRGGDIRPEVLNELASDIREAVSHATKITSGLQDYSRATKLLPQKIEVSPLEIVERALMMLKGRRDGHRVHFHGSQEGRFQGDPTQITQIVLILLQNALDADPSEGSVDLEVFQDAFKKEEIVDSCHPTGASPFKDRQRLTTPLVGGNAVGFRITDQGTGISSEDFPRIFDPFFTTKPPGKGTGLGLSVAQGLTWSHGGILLLRTQEGLGTTVTIKFPASRPHQVSP
jgi:signal transduction histidine kinase